MKKILAVIIGLVLVLAAAVVFLPQVIDWNEYRGEIAHRAEMLTGRQMVIGGDIHIALLPAPALVANDVRISNLRGAAAEQMLRLKSLEVRVALGPLLGGAVQVETVKMVDPVIELERLADGQLNWQFTPVESRDEGGVSMPLPGVDADAGDESTSSAVRLDSFLIENGTVVFRDSKQGQKWQLDGLNARLAADSLSGPYDSAGDLTYRGVPLSYELSLGRVVQGRTLPVNMILKAEPGETEAQLSGAVLDLAESPRFSGKIVASGDTLSKLINDLVGPETAPTALKKPFRIEGGVAMSADGLETEDLAVTLGPVRASGGARVDFTDPVNIDLRLAANHIDLDALLAAEPPGENADGAGPLAGETPADAAPGEKGDGAEPQPVTEDAGFVIPDNLTGVFDLSIAALTFSGSNISEARINAEIGGGEITISQLSALLPGGSDVFATGFLSADAGRPKFDGNVDVKISDLRRVFGWLGIEPPDVPSDRLRTAALKGQIVADAVQIQGRNLDATIDTSHLTGGVTLALRKKLAFGANFKVDRLNLDAYMASENDASADKPRQPLETGQTGNGPAAGKDDAKAENPFPALAFLNRFDANLKLQIERMTYRRVPFNQVAFDGTLFGGNLEIRKATVGDLVGAKGSVSGSLVGLTQIPGLRNVHFELTDIDAVRLMRLFELDAPFTSKDVGKVSLTGRAEGVLLQPEFDLILKARDTSADLGGKLSLLPIRPLFDGEIKVRHADFPQFLRILGLTYRPTGRLGGFGLSARVKGDLGKATFEQLSGRIGPVVINGGLVFDGTGPRPRISADVTTGRIPVDQFLPANGRAAMAPIAAPRIMPAVWRPSDSATFGAEAFLRIATAAGSVWPTDAIDLGFLQAFDADLKLQSEAVSYDAISVMGAVADLSVIEGVLRANSLTGRLFGGDLKAIASVYSEPVPHINGSLSLSTADLGAAELALVGRRTLSGGGNFRMTFDATGRSVAGLIGGLGGDGSFELTRVALAKDPKGSGLGPIGGLLSGLNEVVGVISGVRSGSGLADISAGFGIAKGIAHTENLAFVTNAGAGQGRGDIDLPNWRMKISGDIQLSQNLLGLLLGTTGMAITVPYRIEGPLDKPGVFIDTAKLPGKALSIPGNIIDKTGIGDVLRRINPLAK